MKPNSIMPLHIPDYRADTGHLSTLEHGAYLLLICHYWMTGGLPDSDAKLARITGMDPQQWTEAKPTLESLFTAGWRHKRIERELRKVQVSEVRSEAGKAGAAVKHGFAISKTNSASLSIESKDKKKERGTRIANDWRPSVSDLEAAKAEGLSDRDIQKEAAKFRDYWLSKAGSAGVKMDWAATWRNWCRRAAEYLGRKAPEAPNGKTLVFVPADSDAFKAWEAHDGKKHPQAKGGWYFETEYPPGYEPKAA